MIRLMHGFPPSADRQVTLANWRQAPFSRWAFHHVRELVPSAEIVNDPADVHEWPIDRVEIGDVPIEADGVRPLSFDEFLFDTSTRAPTASSSPEAAGSSSSDTPMV
jgi:hypothetical protein